MASRSLQKERQQAIDSPVLPNSDPVEDEPAPRSPAQLVAATPAKSMFHLGYIPALDGVRAVAVLAVLFFHVLPYLYAVSPLLTMQGGFLGVDVFFVLSGFLITTILAQEYQARGSIDLKAFWVRRALRLMPAIVVVLLGLLVLGLAVDAGLLHRGQGITTPLPPGPGPSEPWAWAPLPYWQGIFVVLLPVSNVVLLSHHNFYPMMNAWTLATEDQFYLLWPLLLLLLATRCRSLKTVLLVVGSAALLFAGWRLFLLDRAGAIGTVSQTSLMEIYLRPDARVAELLAGCALGLAAVTGLFPQSLMAKRVVHVLGWVGALAILGLFVFGGLFDAWMHGAGFVVVTLGTVAVLLHLVVSPDAPMSRALSWPVLVGIGQVSYGIYLWQNTWIMYAPGDGLALAGAVIALTATCALLSWTFVEQPALRLKRRFERRGDAPAVEARRSSVVRSGWPWLSRRHLTPLAGTAVMALIIAPTLIAAEPYRAQHVARIIAEGEAAVAAYEAQLQAQAEAATAKREAKQAKAKQKKRAKKQVQSARPDASPEKGRKQKTRASQARAEGE